MVQLVVPAPKERKGRNGDQDLPAALQRSAQRAQARDVVVNMLEHVEHGDQIEGLRLERHLVGQAAVANVGVRLGPGGASGIAVRLERAHLAEPGEHGDDFEVS